MSKNNLLVNHSQLSHKDYYLRTENQKQQRPGKTPGSRISASAEHLVRPLFLIVYLLVLPALSFAETTNHKISISFDAGAAFGLVAPAKASGTFNVECDFLDLPDGNYSGSNIKNFKLQVGSQLYDAQTAFDPNIQGVQLTGGKITGLASNFKQVNGGAILQMGTNGTTFACTTPACSTNISANAGGQSIIRPLPHDIEITFSAGSAFGLTAPATATGSFDVEQGFLERPDGNYAGSNIKNFKLQVGSQLFDAQTAFDPNIQGVQLAGGKITGLASNFKQVNGGAILQMGTNGTTFACTTPACSTNISATAGGQSAERSPPILFEVTFSAGVAFGLTAPTTALGSFTVAPGFLDQPDGNYAGTNIKNFKLQVGSQLYDAQTAFDPNIQGVQLAGGEITGLASNFKQVNGGAILQMSTNGTTFACTTPTCSTHLSATAGGQSTEVKLRQCGRIYRDGFED